MGGRPRDIYNLAIFPAFLQQESIDFYHQFFKIAFFRLSQAKTAVYRGQFLVRRVGPCRLLVKMRKMVARWELKPLIKPSIYQILKWSNKPFKVHFSI